MGEKETEYEGEGGRGKGAWGGLTLDEIGFWIVNIGNGEFEGFWSGAREMCGYDIYPLTSS